MTRYYFNVSAENESGTDLVGIDLPSLEAARHHAISQVTELWAERLLLGKQPLAGWLEVVDDEARAALRLPL